MTRKRAKISLEEDEVALGRVVGIFGLQGEVRLMLYNRESTWLAQLRTVFLVSPDGDRFEAEVQSRPGAGGRVIGIIDGVEDREEARAWMDHEIVVLRADLPDPEEGEWYHHDILGAAVVTTEGAALGTVREIHTAGAVDTWLVRDGVKTYYVPNLSGVIVSVDTVDRRVVVRFDGVTSED